MLDKLVFLKDTLGKLPSTPYWIPLAIAFPLGALCVYLFLSLKAVKVDLRLLAKPLVTRARFEAEVQRLGDELQQLRGRLTECEAVHSAPAPWAWALEPAAVNLNRRGQILRLHRKGKSMQEIASALHISPGEAELMVKVHDMSRSAGSPSISGSPL